MQHTGQKKTSCQNSRWYIFDTAESENDNQISLTHTKVKGKLIKFKENYFSNKNNVGF